MQRFNIEVKETLSRIIEIEANNLDDAILLIKKLYKNEEIVLDAFDYVETEYIEIKN